MAAQVVADDYRVVPLLFVLTPRRWIPEKRGVSAWNNRATGVLIDAATTVASM